MYRKSWNILVGAVGTGTSFAIVSQIKSVFGSLVRFTGVDSNPKELVASSVLIDNFICIPETDDPLFEDSIIKIIEKFQINLYIPILAKEIILANKLKSYSKYNKLQIWSKESYLNFLDKKQSNSLMIINNIPTPLVYSSVCTEQRDSWFMKPSNGYGSVGVGVISKEALVTMGESELNKFLIQEICDPPEVTVDSFYDPKNDFLRIYCRERVETKSGVCTKARVFFDHEIFSIALKIAKLISQEGLINFQVMKLNGEWVVTDLNLRSGAGTNMTCAAGFNVIAAAFSLTIGDDYQRHIPPLIAGEVIYVARQYTEFVTQRNQT
jgi:carbamoylphosphate synthase large subunit